MHPYERMAEWYRLNPQERSFEWYLNWHLRSGFVFNTPEFFIMGRPMQRVLIENLGVVLDVSRKPHADTWYIHAMSGDINKAWSILPWPLPWIAFERTRDGKRELQIVEFERLRERTQHDTLVAQSC